MIIGWGRKVKEVVDAGLLYCKHCKNTAPFTVQRSHRYFSVIFIPILKWSRKFYLTCPVCDSAYEISKEEKDHVLQDLLNRSDNATMIELWNEVDRLFTAYIEEHEKTKGWRESLTKTLSETYIQDDIWYVLDAYMNDLIKSGGEE